MPIPNVPDPYRVLGLRREATMAEVKAAHRRLAKRYHPDAPHADGARFLAVQVAYELLRDPIRRGEWDRRHAPGPVRAAPASGATRRGGSATRDRPTATAAPDTTRRGRRRPEGVDPTFGPNDRPPEADSWTWTAAGVPWWEDGGSPRTRRSTRRRAPADATEPGPDPDQRPGTAGPDGAARPDGPTAARPSRRRAPAPSEPTTPDVRSEFDVFSRSSGAAWSSASRAYFRRRAADMPSGAANPDTPRWTTPVGSKPPRRYDSAPARAASEPSEPVTRAASSGRSGSSRRLSAALAALFRRSAQ